MDWEKILVYTITSAISFGLMFSVSKAISKAPEKDAIGQSVLKPHWIYLISIYLGIFVSVAFIISTFVIQETMFTIIALFMVVFFGLLGLFSMMIYKNHRVVFDDETVTVTDIQGNTELVYWNEILKIKRSIWSSSIVLLDGERKLKINVYNVGIKSFGEAVERNTDWQIKDLKLPI